MVKPVVSGVSGIATLDSLAGLISQNEVRLSSSAAPRTVGGPPWYQNGLEKAGAKVEK